MTAGPTPARRERRGPYAKSERTRELILDSATTVFAESGYRSASLRAVAEQVGMSEAGLLHHFTSKNGLLAAVLRRRDDRNQEWFDREIERGRDLPHFLEALVEHNASTPGVVELFCTLAAEATSPSHPAHGYFTERYRTTIALLRDAFEDLRTSGRLREGVDPAVAARSTVALMDGLQIQWLMDRTSVDMAAEVRDHLASLVLGEA